MNVLALDASTTSTGYCVGDENGNIIKYDLIRKNDKDILTRISSMISSIDNICKNHNIRKIVIEDCQFQRNQESFKNLAILQGQIREYCRANSISLAGCYKPSSWRKKVGIQLTNSVTKKRYKREELKALAIKYIKDKYNINAQEDVAEAICIYDAYIISWR